VRATTTSRWLALALGAALVLGACGSDSSNESSGSTTTGGTKTSEVSSGNQAFCDQVVEIQTLQPDIPDNATEEQAKAAQDTWFSTQFTPMLDKIVAGAPSSAKQPIQELADFVKEKKGAAFDDPGFAELEKPANVAAAKACAADTLAVTAVDYAFQGAPTQLEAGRFLVDFTNKGKEMHEISLMKKNDGVTQSWDELLQLDQSEAESKVTFAGGGFAMPGSEDTSVIDLEPGDYLMVCFIPVGSTPDAGDHGGSGPPHFTKGMKHEFTVS
jgi:plastocyanin